MEHGQGDSESIGEILSDIAHTLRDVSARLDDVAARFDAELPSENGLAIRLAKLEAWAFRTERDVAKFGARLDATKFVDATPVESTHQSPPPPPPRRTPPSERVPAGSHAAEPRPAPASRPTEWRAPELPAAELPPVELRAESGPRADIGTRPQATTRAERREMAERAEQEQPPRVDSGLPTRDKSAGQVRERLLPRAAAGRAESTQAVRAESPVDPAVGHAESPLPRRTESAGIGHLEVPTAHLDSPAITGSRSAAPVTGYGEAPVSHSAPEPSFTGRGYESEHTGSGSAEAAVTPSRYGLAEPATFARPEPVADHPEPRVAPPHLTETTTPNRGDAVNGAIPGYSTGGSDRLPAFASDTGLDRRLPEVPPALHDWVEPLPAAPVAPPPEPAAPEFTPRYEPVPIPDTTTPVSAHGEYGHYDSGHVDLSGQSRNGNTGTVHTGNGHTGGGLASAALVGTETRSEPEPTAYRSTEENGHVDKLQAMLDDLKRNPNGPFGRPIGAGDLPG